MKQKTPAEKIAKIKKFILNLIFPTFCAGCEKFGDILCEECLIKISKIKISQYCAICDKESPGGFTHKHCKDRNHINRLLVAAKYKQAEKKLIYKLKYRNNKDCAGEIVKIIKNRFSQARMFKDFYLCPIPLHKKKQRIRGFNQAELLTKKLGKIYENKGITKLILRKKNTMPQSSLNKHERAGNIKNAFELNKSEKIPEKILLIDDLTTSGATFKEAAKILKKHGVKKVWCLAFARGR